MNLKTQFTRFSLYQLSIYIIILLFLISIFLYVSGSENTPSQPPLKQHALVTPAPAKTSGRKEGQIIVKFKNTIPQATIDEQLKADGITIIRTNERIHTTLLRVPVGQEDALIQKLKQQGLVDYAESNYIRQYRFTPNDPDFSQQWSLQKIHAPQAWDITKGAGVRVAIVDTGIDLTHPDLASKIVAGADFSGSSTSSPQNIQDTDGHGTHIAGITAAATNNAIGIAGVCPDCQLLIAKYGGDDASASESITWAADQGAKVINMSWGGPSNTQVLQDAVNYAWTKGALPVAAVPNDPVNMGPGFQDYPSMYTNVMNVTNTNQNDQVTIAGFGTGVWIGSPGEDILSTIPPGQYDTMSGTSMATPLVGGVAALVWSTKFGTSPEAVRQRLCDTADKITGTGTQFKCGRLDAFNAVHDTTPSITVSPTITPTVTTTPPVVPTFVCGGSTNSICTPTPTLTPVPSIIQIVDVSTVPNESQSPSINPCNSYRENPQYDTRHRHHHPHHKHGGKHGKGGALSSLLQELINFIMQLLNQIITQLGGQGLPGGNISPTPQVSPAVSPALSPEPSVNPCEPSAAPISMMPSVTTSPTDSVSPMPSAAISPSPSLHPSETTNPSPETSVQPSVIVEPTSAEPTMQPTTGTVTTQEPSAQPLQEILPTQTVTQPTTNPSQGESQNGLLSQFVALILGLIMSVLHFITGIFHK